METFGERLQDLRETADMGLREFCLNIGMEPSNYSRMERNITPAPQDHNKLEPIRKALGLSLESETWKDLLRLADLSRGMIPRTVMSDAEVMAKMPALMRRLDGQEITDHEVEELIKMIRREHEYDPDQVL